MKNLIIFFAFAFVWGIMFYLLFSLLSSSGFNASHWSTALKIVYVAIFLVGLMVSEDVSGSSS